jgi:hypothetical protein
MVMKNRFIMADGKDNLKYFNNKVIKKEKIKEKFPDDNDEIIIEDILPSSKNKKINKKNMKISNELENKLDAIINIDGLPEEEATIIRVKKDNGLLEKSPSKVILIEDNRQVLTD